MLFLRDGLEPSTLVVRDYPRSIAFYNRALNADRDRPLWHQVTSGAAESETRSAAGRRRLSFSNGLWYDIGMVASADEEAQAPSVDAMAGPTATEPGRLGAVRALDVTASAVLVAMVFVVSFPALRGDLLNYLDNPVHLAEVRDLARPGNRGWSDLAFCGFPLGLLQPPLTFGGLAWAARLGVPLAPLYTAVTVAGLMAPPLAFFYVARRRLTTLLAFCLAGTLVLYRGALVGGAASLAGMFGFPLAAAALLIVLDRFAREERSIRDVAIIAALAGVIGLTHMYVTIALVYLALVHVGWSIWRGGARFRRLFWDLPGLALGVATSAAYWMPNILAHTRAAGATEAFARVLEDLVTGAGAPAPAGTGRIIGRLLFDPVLNLDALPQLAVIVLAVASVRSALRSDDDAPLYGLTLAGLMLLILAAESHTKVFLLGPQGARQVFVIRLGLLTLCIAGARSLPPMAKAARARGAFSTAFAVAIGFAAVSERVVESAALPPSDKDLQALDRLWAWMRGARDDQWGRVYVQDTFAAGTGLKLERSHVMASTAEHADVEQVGAYYRNTPYNLDWLYDASLGGDAPPGGRQEVDHVLSIMRRANATHLLLADPRSLPAFQQDARFETSALSGPFFMLKLRGAVPDWADVSAGSGAVGVERLSPGWIRLKTSGRVDRVIVNESFHPFWRVVGTSGAAITQSRDGFLQVAPTNVSADVIDLMFSPPASPRLVSAVGATCVILLFGFAAWGHRRGGSSRATAIVPGAARARAA